METSFVGELAGGLAASLNANMVAILFNGLTGGSIERLIGGLVAKQTTDLET